MLGFACAQPNLRMFSDIAGFTSGEATAYAAPPV